MNLKNKIEGIKQIWRFDNRLFLLFSRLLFPAEAVHLYKYKNVEFIEDHANGDANGAREVMTSSMYRDYLVTLDRSKPVNVLDIGSNNGGFPLLLKSEGFEINKLACVEMNPHTFSRMRFNIERNFHKNYTLFNAAACGEERELNITLGGGSAGDSIYGARERETSLSSVNIKGLTFDQIYEEAFGNEIVDICKIDIEGAEFELLPSPNSSFVNRCRHIIIEIHHSPTLNRRDVIAALKEKGFQEINGSSKIDNDKHYVHYFNYSATI